MAAENYEKMAAVNHEKCASKVQPISNEKCANKVQKMKRMEVLASGEALRRICKTIYSNVKTACTANESMRQSHLQIKRAHHLSSHQEHNVLTFPVLYEVELYLARHIV